MPYVSPPYERPHHPDPNEEVEPEKPSHDSYIRYLIGGLGGALLVAFMVWLEPSLPHVLFTATCMFLAPFLTVVGIVQLVKAIRGTTTKQAGVVGPILWTAIAVYGWFAMIVWIGQSIWGWDVF